MSPSYLLKASSKVLISFDDQLSSFFREADGVSGVVPTEASEHANLDRLGSHQSTKALQESANLLGISRDYIENISELSVGKKIKTALEHRRIG